MAGQQRAEQKRRAAEQLRQQQVEEAAERGEPPPARFGERVPLVPRDPDAARHTVFGQAVLEQKALVGGVPLRETYDMALDRHPGWPLAPGPTGPLVGLSDGQTERDSVWEQYVTRDKDGKTEYQKWDAKYGQQMRDHQDEVQKELHKRKFPQLEEARKRAEASGINAAQDPFDKVQPGEVAAHGRVKPNIIAPGGGLKMMPDLPSDAELPPMPSPADIPRPRAWTEEETERWHRLKDERDKEIDDAYDQAYAKWKATKQAQLDANALKGKAAPLGASDAEQARRLQRMREMEEERKDQPDPLAELEQDVFPERAEAQTQEAEEAAKRKELARVDLKPIPNELTLMLKQTIQMRGPLPIAEFMKEALFNPRYGYYTSKKEVFGRDGDFITSPEVSIMFGECIGAWAVDTWQKLGKPPRFHLVEIGGGKGSLMSRVLLSTTAFPEFHKAACVNMVDISAALQKAQKEAITRDCGADVAERVDWAEDFDTLALASESAPIICFANELFDAFPLHKFQFTERGWVEWLVEYDNDPMIPEHFRFVLSPGENANTSALLPHELRRGIRQERKLGYTVEFQLTGYAFLERLLMQLSRCGGCFLIIDYGEDAYIEDSLRGIRGHQFAHPLSCPGEVDLSAFVSFRMLREVMLRHERFANKLQCTSVMPQSEFLRRTGIEGRAAFHLARCNSGRDAARMRREFAMLTDETDRTGMGRQFKAMCFASKSRGLDPPCPW